MLTTTEAIVMKSMKYRDTSKIVTFYTRQFGKLKGIAKGARRKDNKFGASLEPMSFVTLVLYKKEHRDLHLISQCDAVQSFRSIHDSLEKIAVGLSIVELADRLAHDEEENSAFFSLMVETLSALDRSPRNFQVLGWSFQIRSAALLGYAPSLSICAGCGKSLLENEGSSAVGFQLADGAMFCSDCHKTHKARYAVGYKALSAPAHRILQRLFTSNLESLSGIVCHPSVGNEIDETLRLYLRYHFDNMKDLKSTQLFKSATQ